MVGHLTNGSLDGQIILILVAVDNAIDDGRHSAVAGVLALAGDLVALDGEITGGTHIAHVGVDSDLPRTIQLAHNRISLTF